MDVELSNTKARELLILARKTAASIRSITSSPSARLKVCLELLAGQPRDKSLSPFTESLSRLETNERHYWIGTFYTLLLAVAVRRAQAAYFTPPLLSQALLRLVRNEGFDPFRHSAIDPAAGGAAFLSTIAGEMRASGACAESILDRLRGIEIDSGLARLSEALIADRIAHPVSKGSLVAVRDSLRVNFSETYDLVIANPPYGRVSSTELLDDNWQKVCHAGHVNKYALFAELCFRLAKPGGLVALVLPSSFMAGPLYGRLRTFIRQKAEILALGSVSKRNDIFVDVAQDVSIFLARAGTPHRSNKAVTFGSVTGFLPFQPAFASALPASAEEPWVIPGQNTGLAVGGATLADYGAILRSGYFVWNRELDRMSKRCRTKLDVPLVWARNVRAGVFCHPEAKKGHGVDFVRFDAESSAIIRTNAIVMQRTTNSSQARRLVATRISPSVLKKWGGFVSENHTIVISAPTIQALNVLCFLLSSAAVDARYRQLSGTASVSVTLLRGLDLPAPEALSKAIAERGSCEAAVDEAYTASSRMRSLVSA